MTGDPQRRRAERAIRCYPRSWRQRYGEEFIELLVADFAERPRSLGRGIDLVRSGLVARTTAAGFGGALPDPADQVQRSLAALGCALAAFLIFGGSMWVQLATAGRWSRPTGLAVPAATLVMSAAIAALIGLGVLAAAPVLWATLTAVARRERGLAVPALTAGAAIVLVVGARHFANHWPGTGGHVPAHLAPMPAGVIAFAWAATLSVTSYWAHLRALSSFPTAQIAWMLVSPVAVLCQAAGTASVVRRLDLPPAVGRYEARLGRAAVAAMLAFLAAVGSWITAVAGPGGAGAAGAAHAGTIDLVGLLVMAAALAVAGRALSRAAQAQHRRCTR